MEEVEEKKSKKCKCYGGGGGAFYGLGFVGALIYYFQGVSTFGGAVVAFVKALVWPAFLIFKVFAMLKM